MKTFKYRVNDLINKTNLDSVKEKCNAFLQTALPDNDPSLRRIVIENLEKIKDESPKIQEFLDTETKIDLLNDIGISEALKELIDPQVTSSNPFLGNALNTIKINFENKVQHPTFIVEQLLHTLKPFEYLPQVDKHIKRISGIIKENNEVLSLLRGNLILQSSKNYGLFKDVLEKMEDYIYLSNITRNELMNELNRYQFEPTIKELVMILQKSTGNNIILSETSNFMVNPVNAFIFLREDGSSVFSHNGVFYAINKDELTVLDETEYNQLPEDYTIISRYLDSGKVYISENVVNIKLSDNTISFKQKPDGTHQAFLNEKEITLNDPRAFLAQTGLFNNYGEDLNIINKIWENFSTLISIDFGKEIKSKVYSGLSASLFKLNEKYYVHLINPVMKVNDVKEGTCLQIKNEIKEHMGYDISDTLYQFLEGDEATIAKLRKTQEEIQTAIQSLNEQLQKLEIAKQRNLLPLGKIEESKIIETINEQIGILKNKYASISVDIVNLQSGATPSFEVKHDVTGATTFSPKFTADKSYHTGFAVKKEPAEKLNVAISAAKSLNKLTEGDSDVDKIVKDEGTLKVNMQVKIKGTGEVAKVTGINGVTGQVTVMTSEGHTLQLHKDGVEIIKDQLGDQLGDIEKIAKKASDELKSDQGEMKKEGLLIRRSGTVSEDMKSFDLKVTPTGNKTLIRPKVITASPNSSDDIISLAKQAAEDIKKKHQ